MKLSIIENINKNLHISYDDMAKIANTTRQSIMRWNEKIKNNMKDETEADIIGLEFYSFLLWLLELNEIVTSSEADAYDKMFVYLLRLYCDNNKMFFKDNKTPPFTNFYTNEQIKKILLKSANVEQLMNKKQTEISRLFSFPFMLGTVGLTLPLSFSIAMILPLLPLWLPMVPLLGGGYAVGKALTSSGLLKTSKPEETSPFTEKEMKDFTLIFLSTADMGVYSLMHLYKYFKIRNTYQDELNSLA